MHMGQHTSTIGFFTKSLDGSEASGQTIQAD